MAYRKQALSIPPILYASQQMPKITFFFSPVEICIKLIDFVVNSDFQVFLFLQNMCQAVVWQKKKGLGTEET